ncbi:MAG TPA: sigma-70 family RNA polymerase sigma factor [Steroidobacteraceae bacterium]|nr:sigma-70 family RNA polymerase sigma factor [Steroidobacteraceae bacterium]
MEASSKDRGPPSDPAPRRSRGEDSSRPADAVEQQLILRVAGGDREAFRELYVSYHRRLARFLTRLTRRYDVAEEIINDTLWVVWRKAPEFRGGSKVSTWIMSIAYRRALKTLRRLNLGATVALHDPSSAPAERDGANDETGELRDWLDQALVQLPADQRLVIELAYYHGLSCAEVAQIADCPLNTVKTRMFHARRKLRLLLPRLDGSEDGTHT